MTEWRTWRVAMTDALYGSDGFYRSVSVPARHFRTAAQVSPRWARALQQLAERLDRALGEPREFTVVDIGAGGGELLAQLAASAPPRWQLCGVDLAARPPALPSRVTWTDTMPDHISGLVVASEWLDVVPLDVVERTTDGLRLVEVDADGDERLGAAPSDEDAAWLARWWQPAAVGDRAEVGRTRDEAWADVVRRLALGVALAVDYTVVPGRDVAGTVTGYRDGRQVSPRFDGSTDITAHVLLESCAAAVEPLAEEVRVVTQREALRALGVDGSRPRYGDFADSASYVRALAAASAAAELTDAGGLGGFGWLYATRGVSIDVLG